jgi:hypothetical protein
MSEAEVNRWRAANHAYLVKALAVLKRRLQCHAGDVTDGTVALNPPPLGDPLPALLLVAESFGLSAFERDVLLLSAGVELDPEMPSLCASAQGDPARTYPTFGLALAILPDGHWSAMAPGAPLRRWRLLELGANAPLTQAPLHVDERILHFLIGLSHLDQRLRVAVELLPEGDADELAPSHAALAERIATTWSGASSIRDAPVIQLCGDPADGRPIAAAVARTLGSRGATVLASSAPTGLYELEAFASLLERETSLEDIGVLLLESDDYATTQPGDETRTRGAGLVRLAERLSGLVIVAGRDRIPLARRPSVVFEVHHPLTQEQRDTWHRALGLLDREATGSDSRAIDTVSAQFSLSLPAIRSISAETLALARKGPPGKVAAAVWDLCRLRLRARLDLLADRIESATNWEDLVLPEAEGRTLHAIAAQMRQRVTVYDRWGFAARSARGLGISALFAGQSGTGKTMAAEVLANELRLDLYRIDLSSVVSKYIGETEKNLRRVFDVAEESGAILLFDEADALFGKRTEVKDSHDRYANIEVSYLLQRMEAYRGLAILTTNQRSALDPAFLRRLRFVVQFQFPDVAQRAEIWRRVFPPTTPTEGIRLDKLAKLRVAGGNIRDIALNAAFLAADASEPVRMHHLLAAARSEYAKLDRALTAAEADGWV